MDTITIQYALDALDVLEKLPYDEQEIVIEIIKRRQIEERREDIFRIAGQLKDAIANKTANYGTIEDLKKDFLSNE